ncbi:aurora kinase A-interacting protein [Suncus etruscus]|uniref:aurora kinase A-interacting protein n=1 Tax=Suncus etruscus TaxID=109475 RepID=UPI00210F7FCD|nr:aurora kinase A-interacting protein [Suncus etruscus]
MSLLRWTRRLLGAVPRGPGPRPAAGARRGLGTGAGPGASPAVPGPAARGGLASALSALLGRPARALPCPGPLPGGPAPWAPLEPLLLPRSPWLGPPELLLGARLGPAPAPHDALRCPAARPRAPRLRCRNVLKIRRRKMNHHKYRKLVRRTRFLRRRVRESRLKRKQAKFESDLRRIWLKAGLKEAPAGWQTPKIYIKGK